MRNIVLLGSLLFSSFNSISQTTKELNDQFKEQYNNAGYEEAFVTAKKAIEIAAKESKDTDTTFATSLSNLAVINLHFNNDKIAEPLFIKAMETRKKLLGEGHTDYASSVQLLGEFYQRNGKYDKAELLFKEVITIRKKILPANHPDYALSLHSLGEIYRAQGLNEKAATVLIQSEEITFKDLPKSDPEYLNKLNHLVVLYTQSGQYEKAEPLYIISKEMIRSLFGEEDAYVNVLNKLAALYRSMYQYEKAELMLKEAITIYRKVNGETSTYYALLLYNLGGLNMSMNEYEKAELLLIRAMEIYKSAQGKALNYSACLNGLGLLHLNRGNYKKAEQYFLESIAIKSATSGKEKSEYAIGINNLAELYTVMGLYEKAEPLYFEAIAITKKNRGESNPVYSALLRNLAVLYSNSEQINKAVPLYLQNSSSAIETLRNNFTVFSEKEKVNYLAENAAMIQLNNSFVYKFKNVPAAMLVNILNQQLVLKSFSLADTRNLLNSLQKNPDTSLHILFGKWQVLKKTLAEQYSLPVAGRRADIHTMETSVEELEKELNRKSSGFRNQQNSIHISSENVRKNLRDEEVAIEFVRFPYYNKRQTDSVMYAAYILNKNDSVPIFVSLCEEKQLQKLFDSAGKTATSMVNSFYRGLEVKNKNAVTLGNELYKLIWQPLEPYLKGVKIISYSPAGKLYSIAFQALMIDSTTVLMDKYELQQYTSTRQVAFRNSNNQITKPENITLFGNANFSMDSLQLIKQKINRPEGENGSTLIYAPKKRSNDNGAWNDLPGTAKEVNEIEQLFDQNKIAAKSFVQTNASEENLKILNGNSPQILHIATHGFFLPEQDKKIKETGLSGENTYTLADDPLLRSGLILAGANYAWSGKIPIDGVEDGIATAYEVSQLNLSNTELVVLSACETALGDVKGSEGVFGLQRAFKMAGVKKMIVSLWQVPDKETAELMTTFYNYWMKGKIINESFMQAQADMRKKYAPFYWAAFVLVE